MSLSEYSVARVESMVGVSAWMSSRHYSQTCPRNSQYAFEILDYKKERVGLCLFGPPSRKQAQQKYAGFTELTRLWVDDSVPKNGETFLIGWALRWLRRNTSLLGVVSYSDPNVGHTGVIYRASNFVDGGTTAKGYHYLNADGNRVHIRAVWERMRKFRDSNPNWSERDQAEKEGLQRVEDAPKNRFFFYLRPRSSELSGKKTNQYIKFFANWTRESAWVYGLLVGDGNVYIKEGKSYRVSIVGNDDTISKVNALIPCSISKPKGKNKKVIEWYCNNKDLAYWFKSRGVCGPKKNCDVWPTDLPSEFQWDFVRGLIDSDGCFSWQKANGHRALLLGFSSASSLLVSKMKDVLDSQNIKTNHHKTGFVWYSIKLTPDKSILVLDKIYECPDTIRNEERYLKYVEGKSLLSEWGLRKCKLCGARGFTIDLCYKHLMEQRRMRRRAEHSCSVSGCMKPYHGNGFCMKHMFADIHSRDPLHDKAIGKRVSDVRSSKGVSQLGLSKAIGRKGNSHLWKAENGTSFLSIEDLKRISEVLDVDIKSLLYGDSK